MKILWLYKYSSAYNFDKWLHMEFVKCLARYPGVQVLSYGLDLEKGYPELAPVAYSRHMTMTDLRKYLDYDVVILNTKSRMFEEYSPHACTSRNCWIPLGFDTCPAPKIMLEEDYHYEKNDDWYAERRIDLIIQRHYSQSLRKNRVPMAWLPFSVDPQVFNPDRSISRTHKICFVGSLTREAYPDRYQAIDSLTPYRWVEVKQLYHQDYIDILKRYTAYLVTCSKYDINAAKLFEITASGGLLFTDRCSGLDSLFPDDTCVKFNRNQSDLIDKATYVMNNLALMIETARRGLEHTRKYHTHEVRIGQLLNLIQGIRK